MLGSRGNDVKYSTPAHFRMQGDRCKGFTHVRGFRTHAHVAIFCCVEARWSSAWLARWTFNLEVESASLSSVVVYFPYTRNFVMGTNGHNKGVTLR